MMNNTEAEIIRINQEDSQKIEYSTDGGKSWRIRYIKGGFRKFQNETDKNIELSTVTAEDVYHGENNSM
jgi:hypothetical protein